MKKIATTLLTGLILLTAVPAQAAVRETLATAKPGLSIQIDGSDSVIAGFRRGHRFRRGGFRGGRFRRGGFRRGGFRGGRFRRGGKHDGFTHKKTSKKYLKLKKLERSDHHPHRGDKHFKEFKKFKKF